MQNAAPQWPEQQPGPHAHVTDPSHDAWLKDMQAHALHGAYPDLRAESEIPLRTAFAVLGVVVPLLVVLGGIVWLFGAEGEAPVKPKVAAKAVSVDGTLSVVEGDRLVLEPFKAVDGKDEIKFVIRKQDAKNFDIEHLRSHSSVALPTRIFYEEADGTYFALYKEDAPVNGAAAAAG